jgi:hypothetical protein
VIGSNSASPWNERLLEHEKVDLVRKISYVGEVIGKGCGSTHVS